MSRKFKVWVDSGANIHSKRTVEINLDDIGITSEEWDLMTDQHRDEVMKEIAFERVEWDYLEIKN